MDTDIEVYGQLGLEAPAPEAPAESEQPPEKMSSLFLTMWCSSNRILKPVIPINYFFSLSWACCWLY